MKKTITIVLLIALALTLCACGGSKAITIAVPNDTTNEARALLLLQDLGYIKLKDGAGITATILDIAENPKGIEFNEVEAAQLPNVLQEKGAGLVGSVVGHGDGKALAAAGGQGEGENDEEDDGNGLFHGHFSFPYI